MSETAPSQCAARPSGPCATVQLRSVVSCVPSRRTRSVSSLSTCPCAWTLLSTASCAAGRANRLRNSRPRSSSGDRSPASGERGVAVDHALPARCGKQALAGVVVDGGEQLLVPLALDGDPRQRGFALGDDRAEQQRSRRDDPDHGLQGQLACGGQGRRRRRDDERAEAVRRPQGQQDHRAGAAVAAPRTPKRTAEYIVTGSAR